VGTNIFSGVTAAKTVVVKVPQGATSYGTLPVTVDGGNSINNWANAFRGKGWDGNAYGTGEINTNIGVYITVAN
jgi:hypothetical protein